MLLKWVVWCVVCVHDGCCNLRSIQGVCVRVRACIVRIIFFYNLILEKKKKKEEQQAQLGFRVSLPSQPFPAASINAVFPAFCVALTLKCKGEDGKIGMVEGKDGAEWRGKKRRRVKSIQPHGVQRTSFAFALADLVPVSKSNAFSLSRSPSRAALRSCLSQDIADF